MAKKRRNVDVLSVNLRFIDDSHIVSFVDILNYINGREYRCDKKIFNLNRLHTNKADCYLGIIVTTQDSDIPPKRNKNTGNYSPVQINTTEEGFAYANIFLYDYRRNILLYEINRNGCFPNQLREFIYSHWNVDKDNVKFDLTFPSVVRANEYDRMLRMDRYKKISIELYNPVELQNCIAEENLSIHENILKYNIGMGIQSNANTITIEQEVLQKKYNPMGLSRSMVKGLVDAVKLNIVNKGYRLNVQKLRVEGYTSDSEDHNRCKPIDIIADSFNEHFKITDIQVHRDVQQIERKEGIENLYDKLLPEIRQLIGY